MIRMRWSPEPSARPPFPDHPYGRPARGDAGEPRQPDARRSRRAARPPAGARAISKIAVVGAIDAETLAGQARRDLRRAAAAEPARRPSPRSTFTRSASAASSISTCRNRRSASAGPGMQRNDPGLFRRDGRQSHSRRRRVHGAAVQRGAREARPRLFGLFASATNMTTAPCWSAAPRPRTSAPRESLEVIEEPDSPISPTRARPRTSSTRPRNI